MRVKSPSTIFGQRLREARLRASIAQDQLGVQIGLDEGTASARISRYETGAHAPPFGIAAKLAQVLKLPAAYFYCEDDELAKLILAWGQMSKSERKPLKVLVEAKIAAILQNH